jgi:peptidoglycan/xylan/chitin deacetylase (PgdA/CDA1 family)
VLLKPCLRDALLRPREPGLDHQLFQLVTIQAGEVGNPEQHGGISVEVRCREEQPAGVGEQELFHALVGYAEHQDVIEPLTGSRIDGITAPAAVAAEELAVDVVRRPAVVRELLRSPRHRERELVEVGHRGHGAWSSLQLISRTKGIMKRGLRLALGVGALALVGAVAVAACCGGTGLARTPRRPASGLLHLPRLLPDRLLEVPILLYHRIDRERPTLSPITQRLTIDPADFAAQMTWIKRHGFHALTQRQLFAGLEEGAPLPCRPLVVTFDDGYADVFDNAAPVLGRLGMPATMYVITDRPSLQNSGFLRWRGVAQLERAGFDIGSHTVTHRALTSLSNEQVVEELVRSRTELERHLGHPVQWLAYPHGAVDARVVQIARRAGYVLGVTSSPGAIQDAHHPLELHRFEILNSTGVAGLAAILRPAEIGCRRGHRAPPISG